MDSMRGAGRAMFAAVLLMIGGVLSIIYGIAAISNSQLLRAQHALRLLRSEDLGLGDADHRHPGADRGGLAVRRRRVRPLVGIFAARWRPSTRCWTCRHFRSGRWRCSRSACRSSTAYWCSSRDGTRRGRRRRRLRSDGDERAPNAALIPPGEASSPGLRTRWPSAPPGAYPANQIERTEDQMSDLVAIAYDGLDTAQQVAEQRRPAQKAPSDRARRHGRRRAPAGRQGQAPSAVAAGAGAAVGGALWGGLIGLIFFVPLFGMAIGAATGAAAGALSDYGVDDNFMKEPGAELAARRRGGDRADPQGHDRQGPPADQDPGQDHPDLAGQRDRAGCPTRWPPQR